MCVCVEVHGGWGGGTRIGLFWYTHSLTWLRISISGMGNDRGQDGGRGMEGRTGVNEGRRE